MAKPKKEPERWGKYGHIVIPHLGDPHHPVCDDCGAELPLTRQLPRGMFHDRPCGHVCEPCAQKRRAAEENAPKPDPRTQTAALLEALNMSPEELLAALKHLLGDR